MLVTIHLCEYIAFYCQACTQNSVVSAFSITEDQFGGHLQRPGAEPACDSNVSMGIIPLNLTSPAEVPTDRSPIATLPFIRYPHEMNHCEDMVHYSSTHIMCRACRE